MAVDYGARAIGVAVTDELQIIARPLTTIQAKDNAVRRIRELCDEYDAEVLVIGLPLRLDGGRGDAARRVEDFVETLKGEVSIPIVTQDERLTSRAADELLKEQGMSLRERKNKADEYAAAIILEDYLAAQQRKKS